MTQETEREKFLEWAGQKVMDGSIPATSIAKAGIGYRDGVLHAVWQAWQARAALDLKRENPASSAALEAKQAEVQMPEPVAKIYFDRKGCEVTELPGWEKLRPYGTHELVSLQQVRAMLAARGITGEPHGT